jgi:rare lipoprotein A (peptidoglycan hydrolase)
LRTFYGWNGNFNEQERPLKFCIIHLFLIYLFVRPIMRPPSKMAIAIISAWIGIQVNPAAAQTFQERFSIIPKANAEPAKPEPSKTGPSKTEPSKAEPAPAAGAHPVWQAQSPIRAQRTLGSENHRSENRSGIRSANRGFSGKASYYSYRTGKTASGASFDRNLPTAAHRSLPFGTRVRVSDIATNKSVIVTITDRGPNTPGRVLDLSLDAARTLAMTDRGVAPVRAEVLY